MSAWVYILASQPGGTLYVGVTSDLIRRVYEHREGNTKGFTTRYDVKSWSITKSTRQPRSPFNEKRTSNIGLASGRSIWLFRKILIGGTSTRISALDLSMDRQVKPGDDE